MSPSSETTKQTLLSWIEVFNAGDIAKAKSFGAEGATWWILGRPEDFPPNLQSMIGTHPFDQILDQIYGLNQILTGESLTITVNSIIVTEDGLDAALELVPYGKTSSGKVYTNTIFAKIKLNGDGKITEVREYFDLVAVVNFFGSL